MTVRAKAALDRMKVKTAQPNWKTMSDAIELYEQVAEGIQKSRDFEAPMPDLTGMSGQEEATWLKMHGFVRVREACDYMLQISIHTWRKWDKDGVFTNEDGTPIQLYRSQHHFGERWVSPQMAWLMVDAMYRHGKLDNEAYYRRKVAVQQGLIMQVARLKWLNCRSGKGLPRGRAANTQD